MKFIRMMLKEFRAPKHYLLTQIGEDEMEQEEGHPPAGAAVATVRPNSLPLPFRKKQ